MGALHQIMLAGSLAACAGLRAFSPLFLICLATRYGHLNPGNLNPDMAPLIHKSDIFFYTVFFLAVIEIVGDLIPSLASILDAFHLIFRPIAGVITAFSVLNMNDTILNYILAFGMGALLTLPIQSYRSNCRILCENESAGKYNLCLSLTEDTLSIGGSILAFISPLPAFPFILALFYFVLSSFRKWHSQLIIGSKEEEEVLDRVSKSSEILEIQRLKKLKRKKQKKKEEE